MNILLLDSKARKSAIARLIIKSNKVKIFFISQGNLGMKTYGNGVSLEGFEQIANLCINNTK